MECFTIEEINLMCIYDTSTRTGLIDALTTAQKYIDPNDAEMLKLTRSCTDKLRAMSDEEYAEIADALIPDYD